MNRILDKFDFLCDDYFFLHVSFIFLIGILPASENKSKHLMNSWQLYN